IPSNSMAAPCSANKYGVLPADQARSPAQTATEGLHQNEMSRLDPPVRDRRLEGERDRGGGGVGVTFDRYDNFVFRQAELSSHPVDDPAVGLVRNKPIDIRSGETVSRQRLVDYRTQTMDRLTEDLASLHTNEPGI